MDFAAVPTIFVTLFVIIDPIGLAPMFVALTQGMSKQERQKIAARSCIISICILIVFGLAGEAVLEFVGISMPAFRIAGGILLFITALQMLFTQRSSRKDDPSSEVDDPSVFPLATPLIAGSGSIATIVLLTTSPGSTWPDVLTVLGVMIVVVVCVYVLFLGAGLIERLLGKTGVNVISRLLGMLLAALSVQFVVDGIKDLGIL